MTKTIEEAAREYAEAMCPIGDYCGGVYDEQRNSDLPLYTDAAPSEVENCIAIVEEYRVGTKIADYAKRGWELVQVIDHCGGSGNSRYQLFFTRKKIKNYYD